MHRFIPALSAAEGASIAEIVVNHHPRWYGVSKYGLSRTGKVILDVIAVRMVMRCTDRPLYYFFAWSIPFWLLAIALAIVWINSWAFDWMESSRFVIPTATVMFAFAATHILLVGLVAELIVGRKGTAGVRANARVRHFDT
jgi:hypothetical protein